MRPEPIYVKAGDTFFTHSNTLLGKLIRWGETDLGETNGTWANHMGVVVEDGWIGDTDPQAVPAIIIEALWKTRKGPLTLAGNLGVRVFRPIPPYSPEELTRFRSKAEEFVGRTYGWWKILFQLADRVLFKGRKVLTTALFLDKRPICSYLAARVNAAAESLERQIARVQLTQDPRAFGIPAQSVDPDEALDYCLANPRLWEEIRVE